MDRKVKQRLKVPEVTYTLPEILWHLHESDSPNREQVLQALSKNEDLKSAVLRRVNNGLPRKQESLGGAIRMVGPITTAGMVVQVALKEMMGDIARKSIPKFQRVIQHSEATAVVAKKLISISHPRDEELGKDAFDAGFLHDIGKVSFLLSFPDRAEALYHRPENADEAPAPVVSEITLEKGAFGTGHPPCGAWIAREKGYSEDIVFAIENHHAHESSEEDGPDEPSGHSGSLDGELDEEREGNRTELLVTLRAANAVAQAIGRPFSGLRPSGSELTYEECQTCDVWKQWEKLVRSRRKGSRLELPSPEEVAEEVLRSGGSCLHTKFFLDQVAGSPSSNGLFRKMLIGEL